MSFLSWLKKNLSRCPVCGYYAFNGYECFDCGYVRNSREL